MGITVSKLEMSLFSSWSSGINATSVDGGVSVGQHQVVQGELGVDLGHLDSVESSASFFDAQNDHFSPHF